MMANNFGEYVMETAYEAQLKQELATIAGIGNHNLKDYTIEQLIKEVERQEKDYVFEGEMRIMHPTVQDAWLYLNFGVPSIRQGRNS
jgi:hypothetical protein